MAYPLWDNEGSNSTWATDVTSRKHQFWPEEGHAPSPAAGTVPEGNVSANQFEWDSFGDVLDEFRASLYTYNKPSTVVLLCFYVPIFLLALSGNTMVFVIIVGNKNMRSVTNYFLLNLAIADLLGTFVYIYYTFIKRKISIMMLNYH